MELFLVIELREGDDAVRLIECLVDNLTNARILKPGEHLSFHRVSDTLLVYRSKE